LKSEAPASAKPLGEGAKYKHRMFEIPPKIGKLEFWFLIYLGFRDSNFVFPLILSVPG
jgi:hypothetical protein